jgi:hypothetical protein
MVVIDFGTVAGREYQGIGDTKKFLELEKQALNSCLIQGD